METASELLSHTMRSLNDINLARRHLVVNGDTPGAVMAHRMSYFGVQRAQKGILACV